MRIIDWSSDVCSSDLVPADVVHSPYFVLGVVYEAVPEAKAVNDLLLHLVDDVLTSRVGVRRVVPGSWNSAEAGQVGPFHHGRVVRRALGDVQGDQEVLVGPERGAPPPSVPVRQRRVDRVPWELMERCMALPGKVRSEERGVGKGG